MSVPREGVGTFPPLAIREMSPSDASAVSSILQESSEASSWPEETIAESARSGIGWVAEEQSKVIGFLIGRGVADEFEILNLAVAKSRRRHGVATQLLEAMNAHLRHAGTRRVYLEVRASNEAAIALYIRHGFSQDGRRARYYQNSSEDALIFSWDAPSTQ